MAHSTSPRFRAPVHRLRIATADRPELGLDPILPRDTVLQVLTEEGGTWKTILYTPWITFRTSFWQVLGPDRSCRSALKRLAAWRAGRGQGLDHEDTSPYCKARARLPESALHRLMRMLGQKQSQEAAPDWRWKGRRVVVVDGSTVLMADTAANQAESPQSTSQEPGLGFPIARVVVLFCLATGTVLEAAIGPYRGQRTGENALFRRLWDQLGPGDVALGDRYFCSYFDLALLKRRGVDGVFRLHQRRPCDDLHRSLITGPFDGSRTSA